MNKYITTIIFLAFLSSCISDKGLSIGNTLDNLGAQSNGCTGDLPLIVLPEANVCVNICDADFHIATSDEITAFLGETPAEELKLRLEESEGACIADVIEVVRPSEVTLDKAFCACQNAKPIMIGNCNSYCAGKPTDQGATIFFDLNLLGPTIQSNEETLGNLFNWCNAVIGDGNNAPKCKLDIENSSGSVAGTTFTLLPGENKFSAPIADLPDNVVYKLKLVEESSGASSDSVQFEKLPVDFGNKTVIGSLKTLNLIQYTCVTRAGSVTNTGNLFDNAARRHFYFPANNRPSALAPGNDFEICHDVNLFGNLDKDLNPRLEEEIQMRLWSPNDARFIDADGDELPDVNQTIRTDLLNRFGIAYDGEFFAEFKWRKSPEIADLVSMGIFMIPWVDNITLKGFCPTQTHYNSNDKIFNILGELVGVDTEGIYFAKKEPVAITDDDGNIIAAPEDIMLIREGLLKSIWFHYDRATNKYFTPDEDTVENNDVYFYWPPVPSDPFIRKGDSRLYTVKRPSELGSDTSGSSGLQTAPNPTDRRFGCIPKLGE